MSSLGVEKNQKEKKNKNKTYNSKENHM